ncbi:hypothetical protein NGB36_29095 [Streptomyces sp. RB6PN25]|uniref:Secreted protein n=1 Tax=Streptomyces humicola TaxID=2953240 RepID=A0ABT1Q3M1_9ACTN|nr:hypothetical protein [Streptomyces humicola]MCQ4084521.1 hypothetical protein [Streptomyces humicola]
MKRVAAILAAVVAGLLLSAGPSAAQAAGNSGDTGVNVLNLLGVGAGLGI